MKQKLVVVTPSQSWAERQESLAATGFPEITSVSQSRSNNVHFQSKTGSDVHLFYEIYEKEDSRPKKIVYKIVGSESIPDLHEYGEDVTSVDFVGRMVNIKTTFEIVRSLPKCEKVTFVLGEKEQRSCLISGGKQEVFTVGPIDHVKSMMIMCTANNNKDEDKAFIYFAQIQIFNIFKQAKHNFPNLEDIEILNLPGAEATYKLVNKEIPKFKNLKYNYDTQIIQGTVRLRKLSEKRKLAQEKPSIKPTEELVPLKPLVKEPPPPVSKNKTPTIESQGKVLMGKNCGGQEKEKAGMRQNYNAEERFPQPRNDHNKRHRSQYNDHHSEKNYYRRSNSDADPYARVNLEKKSRLNSTPQKSTIDKPMMPYDNDWEENSDENCYEPAPKEEFDDEHYSYDEDARYHDDVKPNINPINPRFHEPDWNPRQLSGSELEEFIKLIASCRRPTKPGNIEPNLPPQDVKFLEDMDKWIQANRSVVDELIEISKITVPPLPPPLTKSK